MIVGRHGKIEVRINAYDGAYHFLNGKTGEPVRPALQTGDLAKGSATSDPDGFPLYYAGSRDNLFRVIALDRPEPTVLWDLNAETSVPNPVWNDDWDGAPLVIGDYLLEGGENSWFYVIRLHRGYDDRGLVTVRPKVVLTVPGFDDELLAALPDSNVSIENSVAFRDGIVYFANSGGLVQGWDISRVLRGGSKAERVFRFWTGEDTDASVVIDEGGFLYVASELERFTARSHEVGQLMKLDPRHPNDPLVWSFAIPERGAEGAGGVWATPALYGRMIYVATNYGDLIGLERRTGDERWRIHLAGPTWSSPVPIDDVLLQGDCGGNPARVRHLGTAARAARALVALARLVHRVDPLGPGGHDLGGDARGRRLRHRGPQGLSAAPAISRRTDRTRRATGSRPSARSTSATPSATSVATPANRTTARCRAGPELSAREPSARPATRPPTWARQSIEL